jgi:protein-L-isoaspartate O-methyltransferase
MEKLIKRLFPVPSMYYMAYARLIADKKSFLYSTGWMRSMWENKPLDAEGNLVPWLNVPTTRLLEERLNPDLTMFEFGSGYSTLFFASRVKSVCSVESDKAWFDTLKPKLLDNVTLLFQEQDVDGQYCRSITATGKQYDVVIVDGRDRVNCVKQSFAALSPRGVIVLDDSQRDYYQGAIAFAKDHGFKSLTLEGTKAIDKESCSATFFYRTGNCFDI